MYINSQAPAAAVQTLVAGAINVFNVAAGEPGAGTQCNLNIPGTNRYNGQQFCVRASGFVTIPAGTSTSAATPIQYVLYASNTASFVAASGNAVYSSTAIAAFTLAAAAALTIPFALEATLVGSNTPGNTIGRGTFMEVSPNGVVTVATAFAALGAALPSTVNFLTEPALQFAVGVTLASAANIGTCTATLTQFDVEA